jgi:AcrR family transcriptional regulator
MEVPRQQNDFEIPAAKGPRARTRKLMLDVASQMMRSGASPSVSEVAEQAGVSRSTAYRYFPTRAAMVQAVVGETLGPILEWQSDDTDPADRMASLIRETFPRISENESTFRAALRLSLEQHDAAEGTDNKDFARGHRVELLDRVLAPLKNKCSPDEFKKLSQALSIIFGIENMIVLKDIWGADDKTTEEVAIWAARRLINATVSKGGKDQQ